MALSDDLIIQDAKLLFRNFMGREQQFNSAGDRNFCVYLDEELAAKLEKDGWNVKYTKPREEDDPVKAYVQVSVNYDKGRPPKVVLISSKGRLDLGVDMVGMVDYADIKTVDLVLNPYSWEVGGKTGVKAYLKHAFITLNENELELKYADIPDANPTTTIPSSTVSEEVNA